MSDLYREITDEERRTWSATRFTCINAVPVEPETTVTTDGTAPVFVGLEAGKYLIVRLEADDE